MMGELVLNKVKGRKNWRPLFHDSSIPSFHEGHEKLELQKTL